jgi:hypothetical protein
VSVGERAQSEPTRERVRSTIGLVGGYWRPLAAVARLLEELGELAELLERGHRDPGPRPHDPGPRSGGRPHDSGPRPHDFGAHAHDPGAHSSEDGARVAFELADLWIITTALCDQFLGAVAEPDSHTLASPVGEPPTAEPLRALLAAAGPIARIVNHYDGPKTPRGFDGWTSLSDAVATFQRALSRVARAHDVDLAAAVHAKLDAIPLRDGGRFRGRAHDPSTAACLERFRALRATAPEAGANTSQAPAAGTADRGQAGPRVAENARLWGSPAWSSGSYASNMPAIVADLTAFTKAAPWERIDAYLLCGPSLGSPELFEDWLGRVLDGLLARDPAGARHAGAPRSGPERRFVFNGLGLCASGFLSLRHASDPRPPGAGTFVLLSPEHAAGRRQR